MKKTKAVLGQSSLPPKLNVIRERKHSTIHREHCKSSQDLGDKDMSLCIQLWHDALSGGDADSGPALQRGQACMGTSGPLLNFTMNLQSLLKTGYLKKKRKLCL